MYQVINDWSEVVNPSVHAEAGFRVLSWFGNALGFGGQFIILVMSFISVTIPVFLIYRYSYFKNLSFIFLFPYILTMTMHSSRTSVAAAFGLMFLFSLYKKKNFSSIFWLFLAISFHSSAVSLVVALLSKLSLRYVGAISVIGASFCLMFDPFSLLSSLFSFLGYDRIVYGLEIYTNSLSSGYPLRLYDPRVVLSIFISIIIFVVYKFERDQKLDFWFKIFVLGTFLLVALSSSTIIAWRVSYYFLVSGIIVVPYIVMKLDWSSMANMPVGLARLFFSYTYLVYAGAIIYGAEPYKIFLP
jgi:hypothetical protein